MSLNIHIRSTKLAESTDFYNLFKDAVATDAKTIFSLIDGTIYDEHIVGEFVTNMVDVSQVCQIQVGDDVTCINTRLEGYSNLSSISFGRQVLFDGEGIFDKCDKLVAIDASSNTINEIDKLIANKTLFSTVNDVHHQVNIKCDNGFLVVSFDQGNVVSRDNAITLTLSDGSKLIYEYSDEHFNFNLQALMAKYGVADKISNVKNVEFPTNVIPQLSSIESGRVGYEKQYEYVGAFENSSISSWYIPNTMLSINDDTFKNCSLRNIVFEPDSQVSVIGMNAFERCGLTSIDIPSSVKQINSDAFLNAKGLISVHIPSKVRIGITNDPACPTTGQIFGGCDNLTYIEMDEFTIADLSGTTKENGGVPLLQVWSSIDWGGERSSIFGWNLKHDVIMKLKDDTMVVVMPEIIYFSEPSNSLSKGNYKYIVDIETKFTNTSTQETAKRIIGKMAQSDILQYRSSLKRITVGYEITSIENSCFKNCTTLTNVDFIGSNCKTIGDYAFQNCSQLQSIQLPSNIESCGKGCFEKCENLTSITNYDKLTSIPDNMFKGCIKLENATNILMKFDSNLLGSNSFEGCPIDIQTLNDEYFATMDVDSICDLLSTKCIFGNLDDNPIFAAYLNNNPMYGSDITINAFNGQVTLSYPNKYATSQYVTLNNGMTCFVTMHYVGECKLTKRYN